MQIAALSDFLLQRIDRALPQALNRQLYHCVRSAVLTQLLPSGTQLPSSRALAKELGISRNTVTYAYEQLLAEGYLESRFGAGTFVADTAPDQIAEGSDGVTALVGANSNMGLSARGSRLIAHAGAFDRQWGAFMPGVPDVTRFPIKVWSRLQNKYWRRAQPALLTYDHGGGYLPLREAIADYLRLVRSVNCEANQVLITTGIHQSIDLSIKLLADEGDRAWVEEPSYWGTRSVLQSLNVKPVPIKVDAEGIAVPAKEMRHPPRFIFVTPSHQYPLGPVMSLSRRRMLLEYASVHSAWIMEDDYDSEFRYTGRPLAALQGMDSRQRVLYLGSFSKTLYPGLRIGFLVVPPALAATFATGLSELYRGGQMLTQAVLADFMTEGHFASHIRRMRLIYAERMVLLQNAINDRFGTSLPISGGDAGLHLTLMLPPGCDDQAISRAALQAGIIARPLSRYYMSSANQRSGLILGYACVPNESIKPMFERLADLITARLTP